jgi:hypothetical protein
MKKFVMLTLLVASLGVFAIGCQKAAEKPAEPAAPPAEGATPPAEEPAKTP